MVAIASAFFPSFQAVDCLVCQELVADQEAPEAFRQTSLEVPEHPLHRALQRGGARADGFGEGEEVAPHPAACPVARLHHRLLEVRVELVECSSSDAFTRSVRLRTKLVRRTNLVRSGIFWAGHAFVPDASDQESNLKQD